MTYRGRREWAADERPKPEDMLPLKGAQLRNADQQVVL